MGRLGPLARTRGYSVTRLVRFVLPIAVLGLGFAGYAGLHALKPAPAANEEPPRVVSVFVEPVRQSDMRLDVVTFGEVRARTDVELVAQVAGRISGVSAEFTEGGSFAADDPLLAIEDTDYRLALQQARAEVADAELGMHQALAAADVARKQLRGNPNPTPLALHEPQVNQAQVRLDASRARLEQAGLDLQRTRISLPFPGRMHTLHANVGQYVTPGTRLGRAFATDVVEVRLPLTTAQLANLGLPIGYSAGQGPGPTVRLTTGVVGDPTAWLGELVRIDAAMESSTRLVYGLARVTDPYGAGASASGMPLAVGLYVEAAIEGRRVADAPVIPRDALRAGNQVFVVGEDGLLKVRTVIVSHSDSVRAVIADGLAPGEQVVVSSMRNPIDGMRVSPIERAFERTEATAATERTADGGEI